MLSQNLEKTLHHALAAAAERHHEYATLEHLLIALCDDTDAIRACLAGASRAPFAPRDGVLDCNASGTTMRLVAALSLLTDRPMVLTGTPRLLLGGVRGSW